MTTACDPNGRIAVEPIMLTATPLRTFRGQLALSNASGFFFERGGQLFLITSRHVLSDPATRHQPDRIEIDLHIEARDLSRWISLSILLYRDGQSVWREANDRAGIVDVAAIEVDRAILPAGVVYRAFNPRHLQLWSSKAEVGVSLLIVGYPLGFHDGLHHTPVVRHAIIASSFGLRFQGKGYFLTDARTHRGTSGAPVVLRAKRGSLDDELPWTLLGVHSARLDVTGRDTALDETLGLNCAWYADVLLALTVP